MLNNIRHNVAHNKIVRFALVIFTAAFVFWGMNISNLSFNQSYAIKVGSVEISPSEFNRMYQASKRQLTAQFGGQEISEELLKLFGLEKQVIDNLTTKAVLLAYADAENIKVGPKAVFEIIKKEPSFQTNGKFDKEVYKARLAEIQRRAVDFEEEIRTNIQAQMVYNMLADSAKVSDAELKTQVKYNQERRDIEMLTIAQTDLAGLPAATEDELKVIYDEQIEDFKIPEKRSFNLLVVSKDALAKEQSVTDTEVRAYYEEHAEEFFTKPEFKVQQILVKDEATANQVLAIADLSENFNSYVEKYSTDSESKANNGDMGWLTADIFGAEFENAMNSTNKGEVATAPVKTVFGYHIVKVTDIKDATQKEFDTVKASVKASLLSEKAETALDEKIETTLDMVSAGESLTSIADQLGFKLQSFTNAEATAPQPYINTVFETQLDEVSQQFELEFGSFGFVEVTDIKDEAVKPMAEVKSVLVAKYNEKKTAEMLKEKADEVLEAITKNELSFTDAAKQFKLSTAIKSVVGVARSANQKKQISDEIATTVFANPTNTLIEQTITNGNDIVIVKNNGSFQEPISEENKQQVRRSLEMQKTNDIIISFMEQQKARFGITINQKMIDYIVKQN